MKRVWVCACMCSMRVGVHGVRFGVLAFFFMGTSLGKMREIIAQQETSVISERRRHSCNDALTAHNFKQLYQPTSFCGPA